jgi:hypothetical protein
MLIFRPDNSMSQLEIKKYSYLGYYPHPTQTPTTKTHCVLEDKCFGSLQLHCSLSNPTLDSHPVCKFVCKLFLALLNCLALLKINNLFAYTELRKNRIQYGFIHHGSGNFPNKIGRVPKILCR